MYKNSIDSIESTLKKMPEFAKLLADFNTQITMMAGYIVEIDNYIDKLTGEEFCENPNDSVEVSQGGILGKFEEHIYSLQHLTCILRDNSIRLGNIIG